MQPCGYEIQVLHEHDERLHLCGCERLTTRQISILKTPIYILHAEQQITLSRKPNLALQ